MALGFDGSIRIKAILDHTPFDRGLSSMTGQVDKFGATLKKLAGVVGIAFGTAAIINFGRESVKAASELSNAWIGLQSIVEGQGRSFSKAKSFVEEYVSDGLVPLTDAVTAYKNLAARGYDDEQIKSTMTALKDAAVFGRQSSYSLGEAISTATEGLKNENSILVDNAGVTKNVAKMWDDYAKSIGTTANNLTKEQKIQAEVNGILEETRFQTGDAAKLVNTYSGQVGMLGYNFQQLKVQLGEALIPIVQAVLPGINAVIAGLTKLAAVFAKVTALLFGKSAKVTQTSGVSASASSAADSTDKLADSLGAAGDAAKKAGKDMKSVTAPFDEFNILADNAASSASNLAGGLGDVGAGDADLAIPEYEADISGIEETGEALKSLGEIFSETVDSMLSGIPALKAAFAGFGANFNDFNQKLYEGFTFDGLKEKVQQLGRELAEAFNDLVNAIDWRLWGQTLGAGLNLGLQFLVNFLYTFDWSNFGQQLAALINGAVSEIDWYAVGQMMIIGFKIAIETLTGFLIGLDMAQIAQAASQVAIGYFNSLQETIAGIDWTQVGAQVAEFLNNVDWIGVINSIADVLEEMVLAGLDLIAGFIENADPEILAAAVGILAAIVVKHIISTVVVPLAKELVSKVIEKIAEAIASSGFASILGTIGTTLAGIGAIIAGVALAASSFFSMWNEGFSWAKEAVMLLGIALTAVGAIILGAPALVAGVVAAVVAVVATMAVAIHEHWEEIKQWFIDLWENVQEIAGTIAEWFNSNVIEPVKQFFSNLFENIKQLSSDAWTGVQEIWNVVSSWFNDTVIKPVAGFFSGMFDSIKQTASNVWESVKAVWGLAAAWFKAHVTMPLKIAFDGAAEGIKSVINGLISNMEGMLNAVIRGVNWLISQLNKISFDIPDWVPGIGGNSFGINIPKISEAKLPRLANGAVIPPNQQFAAILGDQRSGMNLEAPAALIKQMVMEGIQAAGGIGGDINITVESVLDGKVIARNTIRHINSETRSSGRSPILGAG